MLTQSVKVLLGRGVGHFARGQRQSDRRAFSSAKALGGLVRQYLRVFSLSIRGVANPRGIVSGMSLAVATSSGDANAVRNELKQVCG